jgi:zinc D-Ala-D-Ala carboxypeptidase
MKPDQTKWASKNFLWSELWCDGEECEHCHVAHINQEAINALQRLREIIDKPFIINSAARCRKHNKAVGGAPHSKHISSVEEGLESTAFDISLSYPVSRANGDVASLHTGGEHSLSRIVKHAQELGFNGIGLYNTFVHIDHKRIHPASWDFRS